MRPDVLREAILVELDTFLRKTSGGARLCIASFIDYVLSSVTASPTQLETSQGAIGVAPYLLCSA
jgi:hypothetical protein